MLFRLLTNLKPSATIATTIVRTSSFQHGFICLKSSSSRYLCTNTFKMEVHHIPALSDNYMYLLVDKASKQAVVVDPVEPEKVLAKVKELGVNLKHILATHHHWDHSGGNKQMLANLQETTTNSAHVYGGGSRVAAVTTVVADNDQLELGSLKIRCIKTSCHTTDSISYFVDDGNDNHCVFTGTNAIFVTTKINH